MNALEFRRIFTPDHPDFPAAIALYEQAFPARERIPIAWVCRELTTGTTQLWGGYLAQELVAIASVDVLPQSQAMLLGYLATAPHVRNQKFGSRLVDHVLHLAEARSQPFILELEHPEFGDDRAMKRRRVGFYQRFGAKVLKDLIYLLPALDGDQPTEMLLMVIDPEERTSLPRAWVQQVIRELYTRIYHQNPSDPIFQWLETIGAEIELSALEL